VQSERKWTSVLINTGELRNEVRAEEARWNGQISSSQRIVPLGK